MRKILQIPSKSWKYHNSVDNWALVMLQQIIHTSKVWIIFFHIERKTHLKPIIQTKVLLILKAPNYPPSNMNPSIRSIHNKNKQKIIYHKVRNLHMTNYPLEMPL